MTQKSTPRLWASSRINLNYQEMVICHPKQGATSIILILELVIASNTTIF